MLPCKSRIEMRLSTCCWPSGIGLHDNEHYLQIRVLDESSTTMAAAAAPSLKGEQFLGQVKLKQCAHPAEVLASGPQCADRKLKH